MEENENDLSVSDSAGHIVHGVEGYLQEAKQLVETAIHNEQLMGFAQKLGITIAVIAGQALFIRFVWFFFKRISAKVRAGAGHRIKSFSIRNLKILTARQIEEVILFLLKIAKYLVTAFQLFITVPIIFSLFPATEELASSIFSHIFNPLKDIVLSMIHYIPNLITIIIILAIAKYVLKGLRFLAKHMETGKLTIPGFYADWAWPTFNIIRVLLYAFTVALIFPYLPGSDTRIFQGVSVFVGIIFSLGSSSAIGNLVAGLVITYMRPFKIGDRIKIKDATGFVAEKSLFVIRIRTIKNEYITFPNMTVLNSDITNYNTSEEEGTAALVLHAKVTMGYDVPWRDVYDTLIKAAVKTPHIEENPKPFVLQTSLDDFYASYEINVYTREVEKAALIYSLLYQNIQDEFKSAGVSLLAPHYYSKISVSV